jgi:CheY-like chemotaxis protein
MAFKTALVVDDSKSARFALRRFLENQYYKVETAESAETCYSALKQVHPDVIFLDHVMPGADGFEVLRQLKLDSATANIKIVICSSHEGDDFVQKALAGGAAGVLLKPPTAEQLTRILENLEKPSADVAAIPVPPPIPVQAPIQAPVQAATPPPLPVSAPSKVANIREPDVAIEQRVMNTLRSTLTSPPPPPVNGLNEVAQSLSVQIAQLQSQAVHLQTRIDEEQVAAKTHADLSLLSDAVAQQSQRIDALEQLVEAHFSELHAALEAGLRAQAERMDLIVAAAGERAREEAERTVMNAAARISDQLAASTLTALRSVTFNPLTPRNPAEPSPQETTDRLKA